jgi:hypothetical protein
MKTMTTALPLKLFLAAAAMLPFEARAEGEEDNQRRPITIIAVGGANGDDSSPTLTALRTRLSSLDEQSGIVIFTGNYGGAELPAEDEEGRAQIEKAVLAHFEATADFVQRGGRVYYLPGHQDFAGGGTQAVSRLRALLNRRYRTLAPRGEAEKRERDVMPQAACGDLTLLELNDDVGLLLVNSQWWMQEHVEDPDHNEGCEVKSRATFRTQFSAALNDYRGRRLIVAMHHPLRSYGELGGEFTGSAHLSPFPIAGSVYVWARQGGLVSQHFSHPLVRSYVDYALERARTFGAFIFVSGHDANLQWVTVKNQTQLISGASGRSARPTVNAIEGDFAAPVPGWVELDLDASGSGDAKFISADPGAHVLFQKTLPNPQAISPDQEAPPAPMPTGPVKATYSKDTYFQLGSVLRFLVGGLYTHAYALEVPYEILDLSTEQGGLVPFRASGGFQTNSLRLRDPDGGEWIVRSVTKDATRFLGYPLSRFKPLVEVMEHGMTANHPEAALAMPRLSRAIGVLHLEPRLMYLPDQEGLGKFRGYMKNEVVLLERRPNPPDRGTLPEALTGDPTGAGETKFKSTEDMLEKQSENPARHRLDQEKMLRVRLLDHFVGDADRHAGQWRFAVNEDADGVKVYQPIARDRDQAFSNYDGVGLAIARTAVPSLRTLQPFNDHYGNLTWLRFGARNIDPVLLNQIGHQRWMEIAAEVKGALTDTVIDEALATWHAEAYELHGRQIAGHLKVRRDKLLEMAEVFFLAINQNAEVLGSENDDLVEVAYQGGGTVRVSVRPRGDKEAAPWFDRVYEKKSTEEIRIYAREGSDELRVHGTPHKEIGIRFVGGQGADTVTSSGERVDARAILLYDSPDGATIEPSILVGDERSTLAHFNQYDPSENHEPDTGAFIPDLIFNPDDGVFIGGRYTHVVHGYKVHPFAAQHEIGAAFATATLGAEADYRGLFPRSAKLLDQEIKLLVRTPTTTRNFFGFTNAYVEPSDDRDYYRVRQANYAARYGLSGTWDHDRARIGVEGVGQALVTEATPGRFVTLSPDVKPDALGARYFVGARIYAETNTYDNQHLPHRGIALLGSVEGRMDVVRPSAVSANFKIAAGTAIPLDNALRFVILSRASLEAIVGDYPFYFAPAIRATQLRGYQDEQLAGEVAFVHSTDLRIEIVKIKAGLPSAIGVKLSVDHGRVFGPSIGGRNYHLNYGGGVWWSILNTIGLSANYYRGVEGGSRFSLSFGSLFEPSQL